jgi:hypothetical protein
MVGDSRQEPTRVHHDGGASRQRDDPQPRGLHLVPPHLADNLRNYLLGFSPAARDVLEKFDLPTQIERLDKADLLYLVVSVCPRRRRSGRLGGMRFTTTLLLAGKTATGFVVPAGVVESFGAGKRPPVTVTINGYRYRNTVAVMEGQYMVGVAAAHRAAAGVAAGDVVEVNLELDRAPREVVVPEDLLAAMDAAAVDRAVFESLSYTTRKETVRSIEDAKTDATRQRRIAKAIALLAAKGRP